MVLQQPGSGTGEHSLNAFRAVIKIIRVIHFFVDMRDLLPKKGSVHVYKKWLYRQVPIKAD